MNKTFVFIAIVLLLFGCFENDNPIQAEQSIVVQFMKSSEIDVVSAVCCVSAEDMDTMRVNLNVTPIMISGEIQNIPFGEDRLFEIMCYNSNGNMNYYGSSLVDINSIAPVVDIILYQVDSSANVTIRGTFADTEETDEKIVFTADWGGDYNLYLMDTDGSNIRQLTETIGYEDCAQLSPDRTKIIFHRRKPVHGVWPCILDVETLEETALTSIEDYNPQCMSWHPNGMSIVFYAEYGGISGDIFMYDMISEVVTPVVVDSSTNMAPAFSADGNKILYYSNITGKYRAYFVNLDGSNIEMLNPQFSGEERLPRMNPVDTNLVLFAGRGYNYNSSSQWGLFITDRTTGTVSTLISTSEVDESYPAWSPDGEKIVYERYDGNSRGIYIINKDGTGNKALINTPNGSEEWPHWR